MLAAYADQTALQQVATASYDHAMSSASEFDQSLEGALDAAFQGQGLEPQPARIGRFLVLERVGSGGTGVVFAARDPELDRTVAIKLMRRSVSHDLRIRAAFENEAKITSQLQHPGIVPIHEWGFEADGRPFIVMKLVRGRSLHAVLRECLPRERGSTELLGVIQRVAEAIAYAHQRGVVHGDLKPHNVLIGEFGEVLVTDWGFARLLADTDVAARIRPEDVVNAVTPAWMAPEQGDPQLGPVGPRTDTFSLGMMLAQVLLGREQTRADGELLHLAQRHESLVELARDVRLQGQPRELAEFVARSIAIDPQQRPVNAVEVSAALRSWSAGLAERIRQRDAEAAEARVRAIASLRQRRTLRVAGAAITLAVVVGAWSWAWNSIQESERSTKAALESARRSAQADSAALAALNRADLLADQASKLETPSPDAWRLARAEVSTAADVVERMNLSVEVRTRVGQVAARITRGLEQAEKLLGIVADLEAHIEHVHDHGDQHARGARFLALFREAGVDPAGTNSALFADLIRQSPLRRLLVRALDAWGAGRALWSDCGLPAGPASIAALVDPNPERARIRVAMADSDPSALRELCSATGWDRSDADSAAMLAQALVLRGMRAQAIEVLEEAVRLFPSNYTLHHTLGVSLRVESASARKAAVAFRCALTLRPHSVHARQDLAHALLVAGDHAGALAEIQVALRQDESQSASWIYAAQAHLGLGKWDEAKRASLRAVELDPGSGNAASQRVGVLMATQSCPEFGAWIEDAARRFRQDSRIAAHFSRALWQSGRLGRALELATEIMSRPDRVSEAAYVQGTLLMTSDISAAMSALTVATQLAPEMPEAWCNLAAVRRMEGLPETALQALQRGHELGSKRRDWTYPTEEWMADIKAVLELRARIQRGENLGVPSTPDEASILIDAALAAGNVSIALDAFDSFELQLGADGDFDRARDYVPRLRRAAELAAAEVGLVSVPDSGWRAKQAARAANWFERIQAWTESVAKADMILARQVAAVFLQSTALQSTRAARAAEWPEAEWARMLKVRVGLESLATAH